MVFRFAAPAVDILVKYTGVADLQVGDDEACVGPFRASLDAGDDPLDAAPIGGPVEELLEAARLALLRRGLEARLRAGLEALDVPAQRRGRRDAQDIIETIGSTPSRGLRDSNNGYRRAAISGGWASWSDRPQQAAQEGTVRRFFSIRNWHIRIAKHNSLPRTSFSGGTCGNKSRIAK